MLSPASLASVQSVPQTVARAQRWPISTQRVGGLRFFRIGRLSLSFSFSRIQNLHTRHMKTLPEISTAADKAAQALLQISRGLQDISNTPGTVPPYKLTALSELANAARASLVDALQKATIAPEIETEARIWDGSTLAYSRLSAHRSPSYTLEVGARISVKQTGRRSFSVSYGHETHAALDYASAAHQLGTSILHALACEGLISNDK